MERKGPKNLQFGSLLIYDAYGCDPTKLNSKKLCESVLLSLAKISKLNKIIDPVVVEATSNEVMGGKDPGGYSGFLIIQESHISIHTFHKRGYVTIDLYSCGEFEKQEAIDYLNKVFEPEDVDIIKLDRGLKYPRENLVS